MRSEPPSCRILGCRLCSTAFTRTPVSKTFCAASASSRRLFVDRNGGRSVGQGELPITSGALFAPVWATPPACTVPTLFNIIFWGLLPSAKDPRTDLASLGLDESFLRYRGMYAFQPGSPMNSESFVCEFSRRTSYRRLG